jgi:hypothetical protein
MFHFLWRLGQSRGVIPKRFWKHGGVLTIFDRLFGTYVTFEHRATLVRDVMNATNVWTAINHLIQPPGRLRVAAAKPRKT